MNISQDQDQQIQSNSRFEQVGIHYIGGQLRKVALILEYQDGVLKYIKDGEILRIDQFKEQPKQMDILKNIEQINNLRWEGQYGQNNQKVGEWMAFWKDQRLMVGGFYDENGVKVGNWIELFENYWDKSQVIHSGEYKNGIRIGEWITQYKEYFEEEFKQIASGNYDENGQKIGQWTELHSNFRDDCKVKYIGEYKDGKKFGIWQIVHYSKQMYCQRMNQSQFMIESKLCIRLNKWNKEIKLFIIWQRQECFYVEENFKKVYSFLMVTKQVIDQTSIGGGSYNEDGRKNGEWVDLDDNFSETSQLTYIGAYNNGIKCGEWKTQILGGLKQEVIIAGLYDEFGQKTGRWTEVYEYFQHSAQSIIVGEYHQGIKVGKWAYMHRQFSSQEFINIGGGLYENGVKQGMWTDLHEQFRNGCIITPVGEYIDGKKKGQWNLKYKQYDEDGLISIGQLNYDENGLIAGHGIEFHENFIYSKYQSCQVIYFGQFVNGKRFAEWDIQFKQRSDNEYKSIGKGNYDQNGMKTGIWVECDRTFRDDCQIIYQGEYHQGLKQGNWETLFRSYSSQNFQVIGGGKYEENKNSKFGQWIVLQENFRRECQIIFSGNYQNQSKSGCWDIKYKGLQDEVFNQIGSGNYDQNGMKIGQWVELHKCFRDECKVTYVGSYKNGFKSGAWTTYYQKMYANEINNIGGGSYNDNGLKDGQWVELNKYFDRWSTNILVGEYENGRPISEFQEKELQ